MNMEDLINAARKEDWKFVDEKIPEVCNDVKVQNKALKLLVDKEENVRDLGASILEKARIDSARFSRMRAPLVRVMRNDNNIYVKYRAAFVLASHGPGEYTQEVLELIKQALEDKEVSEFAKNYLRILEQWKKNFQGIGKLASNLENRESIGIMLVYILEEKWQALI